MLSAPPHSDDRDGLSLYCAQGDLVLTGIDESNQVQRYPLEIDAPNASLKVTWESKPYCDVALFKAGSPWYTPIDNWGEAVVVDAAGTVAPRAMTATERNDDRSGVHAVWMWVEEPGEYRVELPLAGAGVSLTGTCTFKAAGGTGSIDID